jgi:hypothetical protein
MSYDIVKEFTYRGFKCEISKIFPDETDKTPFYEYCIVSFDKPTTLDKIFFYAIGEGVRSDAVAALIDFIGLTSFYPGDFNKDVEIIMKIGLMRHEEHIACYSSDNEGEHWKYITIPEMESKLKFDIDSYHDARKRMIAAMKMYKNLAEKMKEVMEKIASGELGAPNKPIS